MACELLAGLDAERHLRSGADQDHVRRVAGGLRQNVAAARHGGILGVAPVEVGHGLPRQHNQRWAVVRGCESPSFGGLGRIGGPQQGEARYGAEAGHLFHRFVGGAILADADAVMREYVDDAQLAQRAQPDSRLHVVGKHHEGGAEGQHAAVRRHAVDCRTHGVLAHAESQVASAVTPLAAHRTLCAGAFGLRWLEVAQPFERRFGGWVEIGRAAHQVGDALR